MLIEKLWRIDLSIDAFLELENDVLSFKSSRLIVLGKLHIQWIVGGLRTLTESQGEINLA